jgi:hypothetical protein
MITTPLTRRFLHGVEEVERTARGLLPHRLPRSVRERDADPQLLLMEAQPSGVRVVFDTTAAEVALDVRATRVAYRGLPRARGIVEVVVNGELRASRELTGGDLVELDLRDGSRSLVEGPVDRIAAAVGSGDKRVEIWLPHNEQVELVALHSDAPITPAVLDGPLWVHHGSSISQGSNATAPTKTWPAVAARRSGVQLRNLGFGGSALVDPFVARVIRDTPADIISVKLGINVVNMDAMRLRSFAPAVHGFLDTIRDGHPDTPLLLISPLHCGIHETTPGPGAIDPESFGTGSPRFTATGTPGDVAGGRLTLTVIRDALATVAAAQSDDPHLRYVDGLRLFGAADADRLPLPDALHPSTEAHELIGHRFADLALPAVGGPFSEVDAPS